MRWLERLLLIPMALGPATPFVFAALGIVFGAGVLVGWLL